MYGGFPGTTTFAASRQYLSRKIDPFLIPKRLSTLAEFTYGEVLMGLLAVIGAGLPRQLVNGGFSIPIERRR
jgi:hypothetical protein